MLSSSQISFSSSSVAIPPAAARSDAICASRAAFFSRSTTVEL